MASTSPNFSLVLATTSDVVNVVTQVANNFSSLDTILGQSHTGSGQLKSGLTFVSPVLVAPTMSGTITGGNIVATTGNFQTITATGGIITVNTLNIGTYTIPATIGASGTVLTVLTGNAVFVAPAPGTGANAGLSNLTTVAINTNLNTFTAGFVTLARVIATSGQLSSITSIQAVTGSFGGLAVSGTVNANVVNCTGGTITAGGFAIGTYAYPTILGSTGQSLVVSTGNLIFGPVGAQQFISSGAFNTSSAVTISLSLTANANYTLSIRGTNIPPFGGGMVMRFNTDSSPIYYIRVGSTSTVSTGVYLAGGTSTAFGSAGDSYFVTANLYERAGKIHLKYSSLFMSTLPNQTLIGTSDAFVIYNTVGTGLTIFDFNNNTSLSGEYLIHRTLTA